jgi:translation initiation factor eIF-2B subunit epsilon
VFFSEVLDSLVRGFKEKVEMDALIIEINASRFANNIPANEVNHWVLRAMLTVPEQTSTTIDKILTFFVPILKRYFTKSSNDQHQCITAIEVRHIQSFALLSC